MGLRLAAAMTLAAAGLAAACTSSAASPSAVTDLAATLDGHAYLSTSVTGHNLVAGSQVMTTTRRRSSMP
jgi:hypothetical protein